MGSICILLNSLISVINLEFSKVFGLWWKLSTSTWNHQDHQFVPEFCGSSLYYLFGY